MPLWIVFILLLSFGINTLLLRVFISIYFRHLALLERWVRSYNNGAGMTTVWEDTCKEIKESKLI
jgi:hypothetical protein